ncbi:zinc-binding dehydrogenase [Rhizobium sp. CF142]|uniref:zinc-binding dehydrogenase n=1 Tax=Rhizobium sp. CF142 TaxID=1144314 RepID=UPI00026EF29C|nr:zinc-binding dehydrogenase [Rhizobium sp. CF142]EJJ29476.1 Zn-dependent alcohol dehydrogenase, class III [Rhizobium sp. CF142]
MRMTAAVMYEQGLPAPYVESRPFEIELVDLEGPGEGEVLVQVAAAGLCHSDLSQVAGLRKRTLPVVGGHEGAGVIVELGAGVSHLEIGDHVVMTSGAGCGHCGQCVRQRPTLCDSVGTSRVAGVLPSGTRRLSLNGKPLYHYSGISSFAQYAVVSTEALVKADPRVPLNIAAMFGCAVVTGAGAVFNGAKVRPGDSVAIIGLGGVGLNSVMAAKLSGAWPIIGIDLIDAKFPLASELGCTHTLQANDPTLVQTIKDLTGGGVDFAFEVTAAKSAFKTAFDVTRKGGEVIGIGLGSYEDMHQYPHSLLVAHEKVIRGSVMGSGIAERDIPRYLRYFLEGRLPVDRLMSGTMAFADLNANLDALDKGAVLRQILLPNG